MDIRKEIAKLATENPELRKHLVPLLERTSAKVKPVYAPRGGQGKTLVDGKGNLWLEITGTPFVEEKDSGERYLRTWVEGKFGTLRDA